MQTNIKKNRYSALTQLTMLLALFFLSSLSLTAQEAYAFDDIWPAAKESLDNDYPNTVILWDAKDMASSIKIIPMPNYNPNKGLENCAYFYGSEDNKESVYQSYEGLKYGEYSSAQELSAADSYNYLFVKGDILIYVWDGPAFSGKNNFDNGTVFYDKNEGRGTIWNLNDYGFGKNISSVKVLETQWALEKIVIDEIESMGNSTSETRKRQAVGAKVTSTGEVPTNTGLEVSTSYNRSVAESQSSSSTVGLTIKNSFETTQKIFATDVKYLLEISAMIESTITTGKTVTENVENAFKTTNSVDRPAHCTVEMQVFAIPQTKFYKLTKTYIKIDSITADGKLVPVLFDGKPKREIVESKLTVEDFYDFTVETNYLAGDPDCPHVASVAQSSGETTSNNSNTSDATAVKEVLFHSQNSLSLAEAQAIAKQNGWELASSSEVEAAFQQKALNVWAYGRMADGRFAVPVQQDQSNFRKGPNIGATGGNQGFFYTTSAPPVSTITSGVRVEAGYDDSTNNRITVVECVDNNGTLVGYFLDLEDGTNNWIETDTEGETKFNYEEIKKEEDAIHLYDSSRQVAICLELNRQEVLYSDANTTSPFSIYTISKAH
jgi:hypothetical protein